MVGQRLQHREPRLDFAGLVVAGDLGDLAFGELAPDVGALQRQVDRADHGAVLAQRDLAQEQRRPARRLEQLQRVAHTGAGLVDLVQEQDARYAELVELAHDQLQRRDLLLVRLGDHHRQVAGGEHRLRLEGEFDRARGIQESQTFAHEVGRGDNRLDAHLVSARLGRIIADGIACSHCILPGNGAGPGKDSFQKGGLAARKGTDNADAFRSRKPAAGAFSHLT